MTIRYIVTVMDKASTLTRAQSYMRCQGCKWPELLAYAIQDCSSEEKVLLTNAFVVDTLGDIAKSYIESFQPRDR